MHAYSLDVTSDVGSIQCVSADPVSNWVYVCTNSALFAFLPKNKQGPRPDAFKLVAGHRVETGFRDGEGEEVRINRPCGISARSNVILIADTYNHAIRRCTSSGKMSTLAGDGQAGCVDGSASRFNLPRGIAWNTSGIYVADCGNNCIRWVAHKVDHRGTSFRIVTTVAGSGQVNFLYETVFQVVTKLQK